MLSADTDFGTLLALGRGGEAFRRALPGGDAAPPHSSQLGASRANLPSKSICSRGPSSSLNPQGSGSGYSPSSPLRDRSRLNDRWDGRIGEATKAWGVGRPEKTAPSHHAKRAFETVAPLALAERAWIFRGRPI